MQRETNKSQSQEYKLLMQAVEQSANSVVITDTGGNIVYVNKKFLDVSGYSRDEVIGKNTSFLKSGKQDKHFYKDLWNKISTGKQWQGQFHNIKKNGEYFWEYVTITPVFDDYGKITHYLAIKEDITKRKEAEEALAKAQEEIVNTYKSKLEFLSVMSHEIRTPLNAIIGVSDLLMSEGVSDEQHESLEALNFSVDNLLTLIDDILDYSKFEAGKLELENIPYNIKNTILKIIETWKPKANEKGIIIKSVFEGIPENDIFGDPGRMAQILNNLISNAIKFTFEGSVTVGAKAKKISKKEIDLEIFVKDTGIGISKTKQKELFKPFSQGGADVSRKFGGSGLGLAIVKKIIELHGGTITVDSEENQGSLFLIKLKTEIDLSPKKDISRKVIAEDIRLDGVRVILIEDNLMNIMLARKWLKKWGATVRIAETGKVAVNLLSSQKFDVALIDLRMPDYSGVEIARMIRKEFEHNKNIPLIALTASAEEGLKEEVKSHGMDDLVVKPFNPAKLLSAIFSKLSKEIKNRKPEKADISDLSFEKSDIHKKAISLILEKWPNSPRSNFDDKEIEVIVSFLESHNLIEEKEVFLEWVRLSNNIHDIGGDVFLRSLKKENLDAIFKVLKKNYWLDKDINP